MRIAGKTRKVLCGLLCALMIITSVLPLSTVGAKAAAGDTVYRLVDSFTDGKDYLIVSANSGDGYALTNPGGSSSGADMGRTAVTIETGDIDADGVEDAYISTETAAIIWTAAANGSRFNITNDGDYLEGKSGNVKIFSSQQYSDRGWTYSGGS